MKVTIDRFEGNFAVCEKNDRSMVNIEKNRIPPSAKEGDVLVIFNDVIEIDIDETLKKKNDLDNLTKELWR